MEINIGSGKIILENNFSKKYSRREKGHSRLLFPTEYTVIDVETTGLYPGQDRIIEISAIRVRENQVVEKFSNLVKSVHDNYVPDYVTELTGITEAMIENDGDPELHVLNEFMQFVGQDILLGFNVNFDVNFLYDEIYSLFEKKFENDFVDVLRIARRFYPNERHNRLTDCMKRIHMEYVQKHRGLQDCLDTLDVYNYFRENASESIFQGVRSNGTRKSLDLTTLEANVDEIDEENPFFDRYVCFTGKLDAFTRKSAAQAIVNLGGKSQNSVTKKTDYLILGDTAYSLHGKGSLTGKLAKAHELIENGQELTIISETVFVDMLTDWLNELNS